MSENNSSRPMIRAMSTIRIQSSHAGDDDGIIKDPRDSKDKNYDIDQNEKSEK